MSTRMPTQIAWFNRYTGELVPYRKDHPDRQTLNQNEQVQKVMDGSFPCNRPKYCPFCNRMDKGKRFSLLRSFLEQHLLLPGSGAIGFTITVKHAGDESLDTVLQRLKRLWKSIGQHWRDCARVNAESTVFPIPDAMHWSTEITRGAHGWHPHLHGVAFWTHRPHLLVNETRTLKRTLKDGRIVHSEMTGGSFKGWIEQQSKGMSRQNHFQWLETPEDAIEYTKYSVKDCSGGKDFEELFLATTKQRLRCTTGWLRKWRRLVTESNIDYNMELQGNEYVRTRTEKTCPQDDRFDFVRAPISGSERLPNGGGKCRRFRDLLFGVDVPHIPDESLALGNDL